MDYPKQALGLMLKQNRLDQNLSLRALAERTGISAMYLSDVENGVQRPADYTLRKLFSELALPYDPALLWQPEFTLHPLTQAILDYRMDRRDAFFDDLWRRREVLKAGCHYAQFLLAEWIVRISRGENREARVYQLRDILEAAGSALRNQDQQWYRLYRGIHHKALDEIEAAQSWLAGAEALGQDEGTQALIRYHEADCLMRLHRPQSALLINQQALDQFSRNGYFVRAIHTRIHQADLFLNDEPATAQTLARRVRQEAERFQCPEVLLMAEERLALAAFLLDQPEAALTHAQACAAVIHRMPLLIAGALSAWLCHRQEDCRFFINRMEAEIQRKHQSDVTLCWIEALVRQDEKQLVELSLQSDPLAGPLQKKLDQLRFQTLVRLGKTELACRLIEQAEL